ncbi:MAG: hypothetical protein ACLP8S_05835 [Solirubrobacteraceae bacterium]
MKLAIAVVLVQMPVSALASSVSGLSASGPRQSKFVKLRRGEIVRLRSTIDATHGVAKLAAAISTKGPPTVGGFQGGTFGVTQTSGIQKHRRIALIVLTLGGGAPVGCQAWIARRRPHRHKPVSLWGNSSGYCQTRGQYGSAAESGTNWLTRESCAGSFFQAQAGSVTIVDFAHHDRLFVLTALHSFLVHSGRGG